MWICGSVCDSHAPAVPVIPALRELKQEDCHRLQASLIVSFRIAWAKEQAPVTNQIQTQAMLVPIGNTYCRIRKYAGL